MFGLGLLYITFGERVGGGVQDWLSKSILGLQVWCVLPHIYKRH